VTSLGKGSACWYCERVFSEEAHEVEGRSRTTYQAGVAKDHDRLNGHLSKRKVVISRYANKADDSKRPGEVSHVTDDKRRRRQSVAGE